MFQHILLSYRKLGGGAHIWEICRWSLDTCLAQVAGIVKPTLDKLDPKERPSSFFLWLLITTTSWLVGHRKLRVPTDAD